MEPQRPFPARPERLRAGPGAQYFTGGTGGWAPASNDIYPHLGWVVLTSPGEPP